MCSFFLSRKPTARRDTALRWIWRGAALLVVWVVTQSASAVAPSGVVLESRTLQEEVCITLPEGEGLPYESQLEAVVTEQAALQADVLPLPPNQIEPPDKSYVSPPTVTFRWARTEGARYYHLDIHSDETSKSVGTIHIENGVTCIHYTGLEPGYSYFWDVEVNDETNGYNNARFEFTLSDTPLAPITPKNARASDGVPTNMIKVEWDRTLRTAYILIQRRAPGTSNFVDYARVGEGTFYYDPYIEYEQLYEYRVVACNHVGCSAPSVPEAGWAGECLSMPAPELISPPDGSEVFYSDQDPYYYLHWKLVPGASGYHIRVWRTGTDEVVIDEILEGYDTDAYEVWNESGIMSWNVTALNPRPGCPPNPTSATWTFHAMQSPPPPIPTNLQASDGAYTDRVLLTWDQAASEAVLESWQIWRSTQPDLATAEEISALYSDYSPHYTYEDIDVQPGVVYYYWVEACSHSDGCSEKSAPDSGFAGPSPLVLDYSIFVPFIHH